MTWPSTVSLARSQATHRWRNRRQGRRTDSKCVKDGELEKGQRWKWGQIREHRWRGSSGERRECAWGVWRKSREWVKDKRDKVIKNKGRRELGTLNGKKMTIIVSFCWEWNHNVPFLSLLLLINLRLVTIADNQQPDPALNPHCISVRLRLIPWKSRFGLNTY